MLSVIVPAHNEGHYIRPCLESLLSQTLAGKNWEMIIAANACRDDTVAICESYAPRFAEKGVGYRVLDLVDGGKTLAMNAGDAAAQPGSMRAYIDADIVCDPELLTQIHAALDRDEPAFASGTLVVPPAESWITNAYAGIWTELPFMKRGVPAAGVYCVNAAGRTRWGAFPETFSDDTYVRLLFKPGERKRVPAWYHWPMTEGFWNLMRNRRRQNAHLADIHARFPDLARNEDDKSISQGEVAGLVLRRPLGAAIYGTIAVMAKFARKDSMSFRGRA